MPEVLNNILRHESGVTKSFMTKCTRVKCQKIIFNTFKEGKRSSQFLTQLAWNLFVLLQLFLNALNYPHGRLDRKYVVHTAAYFTFIVSELSRGKSSKFWYILPGYLLVGSSDSNENQYHHFGRSLATKLYLQQGNFFLSTILHVFSTDEYM